LAVNYKFSVVDSLGGQFLFYPSSIALLFFFRRADRTFGSKRPLVMLKFDPVVFAGVPLLTGESNSTALGKRRPSGRSSYRVGSVLNFG